jgi:hypothetical protein
VVAFFGLHALLMAGSPVDGGVSETVTLLMEGLPPSNSAAYRAIKKSAGDVDTQVLSLTKAEAWTMPLRNVANVEKTAAAHKVRVTSIDTRERRVLRPAPPDVILTGEQSAMVERAKADKATLGVGIMESSSPPAVEYALTRGADVPAGAAGAARITLALNEREVLTIARASVSVRSDSCLWRGNVEGTGAPVMLMWWPGGKIAGTAQHKGGLYSIRHLGGDIHMVIKTSEDRMPPEHSTNR